MVLKYNLLVFIFLFILLGCSKHFYYEYSKDSGYTESTIVKIKDDLRVKYSIDFQDLTDDPNYDSSGNAKRSSFILSLFNLDESNFIQFSNSTYSLSKSELTLSIDNRDITTGDGIANENYYWNVNWNDIPFVDGVTGRVKLEFVLSNVSNAQVYDFSFDEEIICVEDKSFDPM